MLGNSHRLTNIWVLPVCGDGFSQNSTVIAAETAPTSGLASTLAASVRNPRPDTAGVYPVVPPSAGPVVPIGLSSPGHHAIWPAVAIAAHVDTVAAKRLGALRSSSGSCTPSPESSVHDMFPAARTVAYIACTSAALSGSTVRASRASAPATCGAAMLVPLRTA